MEQPEGVILKTSFIKDKVASGSRGMGGYPDMTVNRRRPALSLQNPGSQLASLSQNLEGPRRMEVLKKSWYCLPVTNQYHCLIPAKNGTGRTKNILR